MVYSEHIDISEKKIISILEDKSTYSWEAIDSEKLGLGTRYWLNILF